MTDSIKKILETQEGKDALSKSFWDAFEQQKRQVYRSLGVPKEYLMSDNKNTPADAGMEKRAVVNTDKEKKAHAEASKGAKGKPPKEKK